MNTKKKIEMAYIECNFPCDRKDTFVYVGWIAGWDVNYSRWNSVSVSIWGWIGSFYPKVCLIWLLGITVKGMWTLKKLYF